MMPNLKSTGGRPGIMDCMVEFTSTDIENGPWILEKGYCYIYLPEEGRFEQIFIFDGLNVGSTFSDEEKCNICYDKVSREITAYRDVETGQFLNSWNNTLTGELTWAKPTTARYENIITAKCRYEKNITASNNGRYFLQRHNG